MKEKRNAFITIVILTFIGLVLLVNLTTPSIWDANEAFYIETPSEMMLNHSYIIPLFNDQYRLNKPPLAYWVVIMGYKLMGESISTERVVILFFTLCILIVMWHFVSFITNNNMLKLLAVFLTVLTPRIFIMSKRDIIDILLYFFIASSLYFFYEFYNKRNLKHIVFFYICIGFGFLAKGPVALILVGGIIFVFLLIKRNITFLKYIHLPFGIVLFLLIIVPWHAAMIGHLGFKQILGIYFKENLSRFMGGNFGPNRGLFFYLIVYIVDFFPWSIFVPWLGWWIYKQRKQLTDTEKTNIAFFLLWLVFPIVFFSLSHNKQEYYIMPAYSGGILFTVQCISIAARLKLVPRGLLSLIKGVYLVAALLLTGASFLIYRLFNLQNATLALFSVLIGAGLILFKWGNKKISYAIISLIFLVYSVFLITVIAIVPANENFRPSKRFSRTIKKYATKEDIVGYYKTALPSIRYYTKHHILEITNQSQLKAVMSKNINIYCVIKKKYLKILESNNIKYKILEENPILKVKLKNILNFNPSSPDDMLCLIRKTSTLNTLKINKD